VGAHRSLGRIAALVFVTGAVAFAACSERERPPYPVRSGAGGEGGTVFGAGGSCFDGACGNQIHAIAFDAPNVYFVFDRSGSMQELVPPDYDSAYVVVRDGVIEMIRSLGPLINVAAAVLPHGNVQAAPCSAGAEVFELTPGDPFGTTGDDSMISGFRLATNLTPVGGTPVASTLRALTPTFGDLAAGPAPGTFAVLLTDGGPNCNPLLSCGVEECIPNIEGECESSENCCAPGHPMGGPENCLDGDEATGAVAAIAALGVPVYVVGIPGSQPYAAILDDMAEAGGTALSSGENKYQRVDDLGDLANVLKYIATENIDCEIALDDPPEEKGNTNVYLDCEVLPLDPDNGWDWVGDAAVRLYGEACARLKGGLVSEVKIATGCTTVLR
jgi:hypothetical protein